MIFKVMNHSLGFIPVVHIWGDKLELRSPGLGDNSLGVGALLSLMLRSTASPRAVKRVMMLLKAGI
jgi:hypothetical protein